jgi:hypothetical protein
MKERRYIICFHEKHVMYLLSFMWQVLAVAQGSRSVEPDK